MTPHLAGFLSTLFESRAGEAKLTFDEGLDAYAAFVNASGIEYYNFGVVEHGGAEESTPVLFASNMPEYWLEEYNAAGLAADDYVARQAEVLSETRSYSSFGFGDWLVPQLEGQDLVSAPVLRGCADAGLKDAVGLVGRTAVRGREGTVQYFGLGLGGDHGSRAHAQDMSCDLLVATFSLIAHMHPRLAMHADRCSSSLSPREKDVLGALSQGLRRDRIAERFSIALPTVDHHCANIRRKLDAPTLAAAVARGYRYGFL